MAESVERGSITGTVELLREREVVFVDDKTVADDSEVVKSNANKSNADNSDLVNFSPDGIRNGAE